MNNLNNILKEATKNNYAIGHFNISNLEQLKAIVLASTSMETETPIMIGVSEGERKFIGLKQCVYLIKSFREELGIPIFINSDHSHSTETAKASFDVGFDSVHIDLSKFPYKENLKGTKEVVDYIKSKNQLNQELNRNPPAKIKRINSKWGYYKRG